MGKLLLTLLLLFGCVATAEADVVGWHWYNEPIQHRQKKHDDKLLRAFSQLPASERLKMLQEATKNLRDQAVLSGNIQDIAAYKKAQDFWVHGATRFTVGWEKMLLLHPELNYSLTHPNENALVPVELQGQHTREDKAIAQLAHSNGLLFFYRGNNKADLLFSKSIGHYAKSHQFSLISISVDGAVSPALADTKRHDGLQKASALGVYYFPALVLVNPKTRQHQVVSYGFKSESELSMRLLKIADHWQPEF